MNDTAHAPLELLEQIHDLLARWEQHTTNKPPARQQLEGQLAQLRDLLTDEGHLAALGRAEGVVAALSSLLNDLAFPASDDLALVRQIERRVRDDASNLERARESVANLTSELASAHDDKKRLQRRLVEMSKIEDRARSLEQERDRLRYDLNAAYEQLTEVREEADSETQRHQEASASLVAAQRRVDNLEKRLSALNAQLDDERKRHSTTSNLVSENARLVLDHAEKLDRANQRIEALAKELKREQERRKQAEAMRNQIAHVRDELKTKLKAQERESKEAIRKARDKVRREAAVAQRYRIPTTLAIIASVPILVLLWLLLMSFVGFLDGSWRASLLTEAPWPPIEFLMLHSRHTLTFLLAVTLLPIALAGLDFGDTTLFDHRELSEWANLLGIAGLALGASLLVIGVARAAQLDHGGSLQAEMSPCLLEVGPTSVGVRRPCNFDAEIGERGRRLEVVAYTTEDRSCRMESAAYLGTHPDVLDSLQPGVEVRLLAGVPWLPRPCVVYSDTPDHVLGFVGGEGMPVGGCQSGVAYNPALEHVVVQGPVVCNSPWRYQKVGVMPATEGLRSQHSSAANGNACRRQFASSSGLDRDTWAFVGRVIGAEIHCATTRQDGTTPTIPALGGHGESDDS